LCITCQSKDFRRTPKTILVPLSGASGAIIAFLPIDGRPIDVMAGNFLKALFAPNQYVYHKTGVRFSFSKIASPKPTIKHLANPSTAAHGQKGGNEAVSKGIELQKLLTKSVTKKVNNPQDAREAAFLKTFSQSAAASTAPTPVLTASPLRPHTAPTLSPPPAAPPEPKKTPQSEVLYRKRNSP
jgi:hypothetical protein